MAKEIPGPGSYPDRSFDIQLDGTTYRARWLWNERVGVWTFSLADRDGVAIVSGVRAVLNVDLLSGCVDPRRPPGPILVVDPTGTGTEATIDSLGQSVKVVYLTAAEIAA